MKRLANILLAGFLLLGSCRIKHAKTNAEQTDKEFLEKGKKDVEEMRP